MARTTRIMLDGDKLAADQLRLRHGVRLLEEFRRLTGFQKLRQNERLVHFDDGSFIHLHTRFGDETMLFFAPPATSRKVKKPEELVVEYLPFFQAYRGSEPVWVLCRGGMNFGPPYEILDDEFSREDGTRVCRRDLETLTILPHLNPQATYLTAADDYAVSADAVQTDPNESGVYSITTTYVADTHLYVHQRESTTRLVDIASFQHGHTQYQVFQYENGLSVESYAYWGETVYGLREQGAVADDDPNNFGVIASVAPFTEGGFGYTETDLITAQNGIFRNLGPYYKPLKYGAALQEGGWFSWACYTSKGADAEGNFLRGIRMGIMQDGAEISDLVLSVGEVDRKFIAEDGTELLFRHVDAFDAFSYSPVDAEFEPLFGVLRREVVQDY